MQNPESTNAQFLDLKQVAERTSRSYWSVRFDVVEGRLASVRFTPRGKYYVRPSDLETFIERHRSTSFEETL